MTSPQFMTGMSGEELAALLGDDGRPSMARANALLRWIWRPGASLEPLPESIEGISRRVLDRVRPSLLPPDLREEARRVSTDGSIKLLLSISGAPVECVMIPGRGRTTVCVSSQSGCTRRCAFCATARMGFRRNLWAGEIVAQVLMARAVAPRDRPLRNVVFMGMGEPLDNLEQVVKAVDVLCTPAGASLAASHITVSTSGVLPRMQDFVDRSQACLALSLNATTEAQRRQVMPIEVKWHLYDLIEFIKRNGEMRLFFVEYILMGGFNDSETDAERLARLMEGLNVRVNLIPLNPHPGSSFERPRPEKVQHFFNLLNARGIRAMIRMPRGDDISAACGQLQQITSA